MPISRFRHLKALTLTLAIAIGWLLQCATPGQAAGQETITVAGGCFWCVEADFEKVRGVTEAVSGYTGGTTRNPTYKQVTRGGTGHYEAVQIHYDPGQISARQLYDLFFRSIDPTDAGGQFCDRGDSYRTAIFVSDLAQQAAAMAAKSAAEAELGRKIVTPILPAKRFYEAEAYHQNYYKSDDRLAVTSVGIAVPKKVAYKRYRNGCGRDQRIRQLWGSDAPFVN